MEYRGEGVVMDWHLDKLLNLPHVTVESCRELEGDVLLQLGLLNDAICCPHCGYQTDKLMQSKKVLIRDLSVFGQVVYLQVPRRQFHCLNCDKYPTERLEFVALRHRYTERYEQWIYEQVRQRNLEQVSQSEGLSVDVVRGIFNQRAEAQIAKKNWAHSSV
jgi:transposase